MCKAHNSKVTHINIETVSPFPITLAIGLYNSLYYRTSRDIETVSCPCNTIRSSVGCKKYVTRRTLFHIQPERDPRSPPYLTWW